MKKLKRKQPRRMTPPLALRAEDGERSIVEVDGELLVGRLARSAGRVTAYLTLGAGLRVRVGSRCVNKRRVPVLVIRPSCGCAAETAPILDGFRRIRGA